MNRSNVSGAGRVAVLFAIFCVLPAGAQETLTQYLSGKGPADAVPWDFSVNGGRRAGEWTTIPVPSNWELHGFGTYNYGQESAKSNEHGFYRKRFTVPASWKGRRVRIVFEGVMTDAAVTVNGRAAGVTHQGGFYRFRYDITALVKSGEENLLEVDAAKVSSNQELETAERGGDYWVFGGIYRPVYLEALPAQAIEHAAIDARADGALHADVTLASVRDADRVEAQVVDADGKPVGAPFTASIPGGGTGRVELSAHIDAPQLWTAETPHLYSLRLTLRQGSQVLHTVTERFGFRTFEVRRDGLFLNGQRILLKGVGRHAFRPETGRALNSQDSYDDVRLIKSMNMNAVRMTHYPPDVAFLEACDELGLYVLDELSGWQHAQDTPIGRRLVREMVTRDVNHPSILFWDNGNEGGWNRELDSEFALYDPQHRSVLHPWEAFNGVDTKHYPAFDDLDRRLHGPNLVMPTEALHGIYDGGAGAGLEDYWNAISRSPFGAGLFIWVFADEGVVRTDQGGRVDVFSTFAPDGILGPHHEKEGSFYTIRDLYSPVQVTAPVLDAHFSGTVAVENRFDFTSLAECRFTWKLLRYRQPAEKDTTPIVLSEGVAAAPAVAPHATGSLTLPDPKDADALALTVSGPDREELWTSVWPTAALDKRFVAAVPQKSAPAARLEKSSGELRLRAGNVIAAFNAADGVLRSVRNGSQALALSNGPRLSYAKPPVANDVEWLPLESPAASTSEWIARLAPPRPLNCLEITLDYPRGLAWAGYKLEISPDGQVWKTIYDATRRSGDGKLFEFPPQLVAAVKLSQFRRTDGQPVLVRSVRAGYAAARFPASANASVKVTSGVTNGAAWVESSGGGLTRFRWTMLPDASLRLDYEYTLTGDYAYYGISFDHPEDQLRSMRWLGGGPYRVWKNRLRGASLGVHELARNQVQPGENWTYPESQGYFPALRWARFDTVAGAFSVTSASPDLYLRVGTPRISLLNTSPAFPAGDLSFLHAIPAMGSKFMAAEKTGPLSGWSQASGPQTGSLVFRFEAEHQR